MKKTFTGEDGMSLTKETQSSVQVTQNSKGYNWEIKLYFDESEEGRADKTILELKRVDTLLKQQFGERNG